MKKILFLVSHLGSDSDALLKVLDENQRIQVCRTSLLFDQPDVGLQLVATRHKCDTTAAIWAEELLHNYRLSHPCFYQWARFIYLIRDARSALHAMQPDCPGRASVNLRYYTYRLRRICEMARCTPGAVLLTNLQKPLTVLEDYLTLREPLHKVEVGIVKLNPFITPEQVRKGQESYERHFYYLRKLTLLSA